MNNKPHFPQGNLYDSNGTKLKEGQVCWCKPGMIAKRRYKVEIIKKYYKMIISGKNSYGDYLCTNIQGKHSAIIWNYWMKRLTIIKI